MPIGFRRGVHVAVIERDLVVCDLRHDRWLACPDALDNGGDAVTIAGLSLRPSAAEALVGSSLAAPGPSAVPIAPTVPPRATAELATDGLVPDIEARDLGDLVLALLEAGWRIATRRYAAGRGAATGAMADAVARDVACCSRLLLFVPWTRRCMPRTLIVRAFLHRRGHAARIVFGARLRPFGAHCWLQDENCVIADRLDHVTGYTAVVAC